MQDLNRHGLVFEDHLRDGYRLTANVDDLSVPTITRWLRDEAYWAKGRTREDVETSIEHSHLYGVVDEEGRTVACTRVVTDQVTFAWVCDVFVDAAQRGSGLGTWMVAAVVLHWSRVGVRRIMLGTRDAHEVYARVGFEPLTHPERMMQIDRRPAF